MQNVLGGLSAMLVLGLLLSGCHEPTPPPAPQSETGRVTLKFTYEDLDSNPFSLDSTYLTASDDVITINRLKYYLSSVRLRRADSSEWQAPDAAFLIDALHRDTLSLRGVPPGDYVSLAFDIGLDSVTNSRLDHGGDLAPSKEMQWSWSTGYKFLSLDGQWWLGTQPSGIVEYHIGRAPTLRTVRRRLSRAVQVKAGSRNTVRLTVRPQIVFGGPNVMQLSDSHNRNVMFDTPQAISAADNYVTMFGSAQVE